MAGHGGDGSGRSGLVTSVGAPRMRVAPGTLAAVDPSARARLMAELADCGLHPRLWARGLLATNLWCERFEVRGLVARGARSVVLDVVDPQTGQALAAKVLDRGAARNVGAEALRAHEASVLHHLGHRSVPRLVASLCDEEVGVDVLLLERLGGTPLAASTAGAPLSLADARAVLAGALEALAALHAAGFVHRAIEPAHVVLDDGVVRLVGFGNARRRAHASVATLCSSAATLARDWQATLDARADLCALGATVVAALAGKSVAELPGKDAAVDVDAAVPHAPSSLRALLRSLVAAELDARPPSARTCLERLAADRPRPLTSDGVGLRDEVCRIIAVPTERHRLEIVANGMANGAVDVRLLRWRTVLGRAPTNDIVLDDHCVSREHASLELHGDRMLLRDHASTNGTFVNGVEQQRAWLGDGDVIELGSNVVMRFRIVPWSAPALPPPARPPRVPALPPSAATSPGLPADVRHELVAATTAFVGNGPRPRLGVRYWRSDGKAIVSEHIDVEDTPSFAVWWASRGGRGTAPKSAAQAVMRAAELCTPGAVFLTRREGRWCVAAVDVAGVTIPAFAFVRT